MIDFSGQTHAALLRKMLGRIPDTFDKRDTSPIPTALGPAAYTFEGFYLSLDRVQQQAFYQFATGDNLDLLAPLAGVSRYQASAAVRLGVFNVAVPIGARFSTINGSDSINFIVTAAAATPMQYHLTAETVGSIGNVYVGPILPITTIQGLTSARIADILIPGDDVETDEELRVRMTDAFTSRPFGGNVAAYRADILDIDGVGAVQVYPVWSGGGTVLCSILGANFLPGSTELVESVQNAIDPPPNQGLGLGLAPIGSQVTITAPESVAINVSATLTLAAGYTPDQVKPLVEESVEAYLLAVRRAWDVQVGVTVEYAANVYLSRVLASIVGTTGVVNATNVTLNGGTNDITLTQTGALQQVPIMGSVMLIE